MADPTALEAEVAAVATSLRRQHRSFALVGGLAVAVHGEMRFTRDVDLAVVSASDGETKALAADLAASGYEITALVEHGERSRLASVRVRTRARIHIDLLVASSGIESEIVAAAAPYPFPGAGTIAVACAEDLLATKILSMSEQRPQDRIDARGILLVSPDIDLVSVRARLRLIAERGFDRGQALEEKLDGLLRELATT